MGRSPEPLPDGLGPHILRPSHLLVLVQDGRADLGRPARPRRADSPPAPDARSGRRDRLLLQPADLRARSFRARARGRRGGGHLGADHPRGLRPQPAHPPLLHRATGALRQGARACSGQLSAERKKGCCTKRAAAPQML